MRTYRLLSIGVLAGMACAAVADDQFLVAVQDVKVRSFFTLDFGEFGQSEGEVSETRFLFQIDRSDNTAGFITYNQNIDSLTLPGGFETGDIRVTIVPGSSSGTFNPDTGEFETQEDYLIFFDGDLSEFGIKSPLLLPSASSGTISFSDPRSGGVTQIWEGEGELENPFDPKNPLIFTYTCTVESDHSQVDRGDLNCDGAVNAFDIEPFLLAMNDPDGYDEMFDVCDTALGDFDLSGAVDPFDIEAFLAVMFGQ